MQKAIACQNKIFFKKGEQRVFQAKKKKPKLRAFGNSISILYEM